jgi:hypothetical protein
VAVGQHSSALRQIVTGRAGDDRAPIRIRAAGAAKRMVPSGKCNSQVLRGHREVPGTCVWLMPSRTNIGEASGGHAAMLQTVMAATPFNGPWFAFHGHEG